MQTPKSFSIAVVLAVGLVAASQGGAVLAETARWSWQRPHARVIETGNLEWAPQPFFFEPGESVRYVDYQGGDDANAGTSPKSAWQHHPWDPDARGVAADCRGADTYVFKRGVAYRGQLVARESGAEGRPIRLTRDPAWGEGEAEFRGSLALEGGWRRCAEGDAPASMPEPQMVWYQDLGTGFYPRALWMVADGRITRIPLARDPNWQETNPDDVKSEWYEWQHTEVVEVPVGNGQEQRVWGFDSNHLTTADEHAYDGATVWSEYVSVMGTPYANPIEQYDPARHAIRFAGPWGPASYNPILHCRYFLENHPRFLDSPGEYYYAAEGPFAGRLYVRLPEERDPNTVLIEAPRTLTMIDIRDQSHIHVTGLTFRFQNVAHWYDRW